MMKSDYKYKIICITIGLCLSIVVLELFLRLLGFGYIVTHRLPKNIDADYRILCIGESTTWGIGAQDPLTQSYPKQLERRLRARFPDKKINCFYDMAIGQNTSEILSKLPLYIKTYQPRIVIFMVGANNWWNMDKSNILLFNKNSRISNFTLKTLIFLDKFRTWKLLKLMGSSFGLYKERWNYWFPGDETFQSFENKILNSYGEEIFNILNKVTEYDTSEMLKTCKANNIKTIICAYPRTSNYIQRSISEKFGIPFVDNTTFFEQLSNSNEYFSNDGWHPNDKGYKLVAENIYNCIIENKLIK